MKFTNQTTKEIKPEMAKLSASQEKLLLWLCEKCDKKLQVRSTNNRHIALSLRIPEITVIKALEALENKGKISRTFNLNRIVAGGVERIITILQQQG